MKASICIYRVLVAFIPLTLACATSSGCSDDDSPDVPTDIGTDTQSDAIACSDAQVEGPPGDATCHNDLDDDCDGFVDSEDPDCSACLGELDPEAAVALPADDSFHDEAVEWWYWTGHLQTDIGRWFGFELAFFKFGQAGTGAQMVNVAITDIEAEIFDYRIANVNGWPTQVENGFELAIGFHSAIGGGGDDQLHFEIGDYRVDLTLSAGKLPVFQHENGYTDYDFGGYTYYYSRERMPVTGLISIGGVTLNVDGTAWFDHQYGDLNEAVQLGWDWFAIQLDDNREIMIYNIHQQGADLQVGGSYTDELCVSTEIDPGDVDITVLNAWTSPHTGCIYPSGWEITVGDLELIVEPVMADQELSDVSPVYWEGANVVSGDATGRAYVELTGYCH